MTLENQPEKFYPLNSEEKLTITSLASALVSGDADMYSIHVERLWDLQQNRVIAALIAVNMTMHLSLINKNLIPSDPKLADAFFLSCYDNFPSRVTQSLDENDKVSWFVASYLLRFGGDIEQAALDLMADDLEVTTTQLILAATAHAFALSSDPVAYVQEELEAVLINLETAPDLISIPTIYTSSYFDSKNNTWGAP